MGNSRVEMTLPFLSHFFLALLAQKAAHHSLYCHKTKMTHHLPIESPLCSAVSPRVNLHLLKFASGLAHVVFCGSHAGLAQCLSNLFMGVLSLLLLCKWYLASYCIIWLFEHIITLSMCGVFSRSLIWVSRLDSLEGKDLAPSSSDLPHVLLKVSPLTEENYFGSGLGTENMDLEQQASICCLLVL